MTDVRDQTPGFAGLCNPQLRAGPLTPGGSAKTCAQPMAAHSPFAVSPHVLDYPAHQTGRPVPSAEIAASVGTHAVAIRWLLSGLVEGGLVVARKDVAWGFTLVQPPGQSPLLAVDRVVEPRPERGLGRTELADLNRALGPARPSERKP